MIQPLFLTALLLCSLVILGCSGTGSQATVSSGSSTPGSVVWTSDTPVGDIVTATPATAKIFELVSIDYCCGGNTTVADASKAAGVNIDRLLGALRTVGVSQARSSIDWQAASVDDLIDHIVATYHADLRATLPRLKQIIATVERVHGKQHPELADVQATFLSLRAELENHMHVEEQEVFPVIRALAAAGQVTAEVEPMLSHLLDDHESAGEALLRLHQLTQGYQPRDDACSLYREMLSELERFERQMMTHVHLENNVLFPKAKHLAALGS